MRVTVSAIFFLIAILILSIFVANVANLIATDTDRDIPNNDSGNNLLRKYDIGDSKDHLMWFLQISDIHISIFKDPLRITQLEEFCDITVDAFNPHVVLASGDLTDAKTRDAMGSKQDLNEWKHYKRILDESGVTKKTTWLDVRGNHDNFNVMNIKSPYNYYLNYSVQGPKYSRSYAHHIPIRNEKYSFIAVDACLEPGPRRPFNFVGILTNAEINKIKRLIDQSKKIKTDHTIWFGHYPTSAILSKYKNGIREIIGKDDKAMAYLCGHYHTLGGLSPEMYTLQRGGYLELELADWKDNRMFRLGVIDHGQFSFIDIKHGNWPVVLITNPKHALYAMPSRENIQSIIDSTHIRVLAFSTTIIKKVSIKINKNNWIDCDHIDGPLYVAKWNTSSYQKGIHYIYAKVIDDYDRIKEIVQPFSLDGTRLSFRIFPRFILMSDASSIFAVSFGIMLVITVLPLCFLKIYHKFCISKRIKRPHLRMKFLQILLRKFWILSTIDGIFYPMVIYPLYLVIGPWTAGEVIENQFGWVFAWGIYIGNSYLPGSFTYAYGFFQLFTFHMPLNIILAHIIDKRFRWTEKPPKKNQTIWQLLWQNLPFILLIFMQTSMTYFFWLAYGNLATIFCPLRTWSIIMALILWYHANTLDKHNYRSAALVWGLTKQYSLND